ncbi:hypothetical protein FGG78_28395 [Thioclava sp. BHET1]|nr:hypothetical protein FGG78_28395 [Thioclava sp. BHET1]
MARWSEAASHAEALRPAQLRRLREAARQLLPALNRIEREAERRRISALPPLAPPPGADWIWRAGPWHGPLADPTRAGLRSGTEICPGLSVFHDSSLEESTLRQLQMPTERDLPPLALALDTLGFDGSFLSLVLDLPEDAIRGVERRHLIRLETVIETEDAPEIYARLNVQSGPNTEQLLRALPREEGRRTVEFDLAYTELNEKRVERMWIDLIFDKVAMNRIVIRDMVFCRRPRTAL